MGLTTHLKGYASVDSIASPADQPDPGPPAEPNADPEADPEADPCSEPDDEPVSSRGPDPPRASRSIASLLSRNRALVSRSDTRGGDEEYSDGSAAGEGV